MFVNYIQPSFEDLSQLIETLSPTQITAMTEPAIDGFVSSLQPDQLDMVLQQISDLSEILNPASPSII